MKAVKKKPTIRLTREQELYLIQAYHFEGVLCFGVAYADGVFIDLVEAHVLKLLSPSPPRSEIFDLYAPPTQSEVQRAQASVVLKLEAKRFGSYEKTVKHGAQGGYPFVVISDEWWERARTLYLANKLTGEFKESPFECVIKF